MSKYNAVKTTVDNIRFDSQAEAKYYRELKLLKTAKVIKDFELQPEFEIVKSYQHPETKKKVRGVVYKADFKVIYPDGRFEIVDVKGMKTPVYKLKKKMFESQYGIAIKEVTK